MNKLQEIFTNIFQNNVWNEEETVSGVGSTMLWTTSVRKELPLILQSLKVSTLLDAGCGDWNWMSDLKLQNISIQACDIVPELINSNQKKYSDKALFFVADITSLPLPEVDLILCRTVLFHLSIINIKLALDNFLLSNSKYLLMTNHPYIKQNEDIADGGWRRINFNIPPFNLPKAAISIMDGRHEDGYLELWRMKNGSFCF